MKVKIKLSRVHPQGAMNFGRHVVTMQAQEIELNEKEQNELKNDGPKAWFSVEEIIKEEPKVSKKKVSKKVNKKVS